MDATYVKGEKKLLERETKFKNGIDFATIDCKKSSNSCLWLMSLKHKRWR
jgi:hypothetical protein